MKRMVLHVRQKGGGERSVALDKPVLSIGRYETCDIALPDSNVSRTHARVFVDTQGVEIEDQGSKNFTFVNGEAVRRTRLEIGDVITIGESTLTLEEQTDEAVVALKLSAEEWDITDRISPDGMTLLSPEAYLEKGKQTLHSDLGRLVQMYRFSQRVNEKLGRPSDLMEEIARSTHAMFEADTCVMGMLAGEGGVVETYAFPPLKTAGRSAEEPLLPREVMRQIESETKSFLIRVDPTHTGEERASKRSFSIMCAPFISQGEKLGYFYVLRDDRKGEFTRWDLEYLTAVANLGGVAIANARQFRTTLDENKRYENILQSEIRFVGRSSAVQQVHAFVQKVAHSDASVLVTGESGTGKELVARAIHAFSPRRLFPFVPINCAAIPDNLLESELLGVERGAFTDAKEKPGRIELADRGTLFLDEISDMNPTLQAKLLRVLEHKEFERLGGIETRSVDVRIIAATNRDIGKEVQEGRFREDLLYRIQVLKVGLPPLRDRREDIPLLADYFLQRFAERKGTCAKQLSGEAMDLLLSHGWPGNVRELENAIESALVLSSDWILWPHDFPFEIHKKGKEGSAAYPSIQDVEKEHILKTLRFCNGNKKRTSRLLGITRQTLDNKLAKYGRKNSGKT